MADINDLKQSITEKSRSNVISLLQDIRAERRKSTSNNKTKSSKSKKKKKESTKKSLKKMFGNMNKEQAQEMYELLKEEDNE